jgi:Phosphodiester glycosidase
MTRTRWLAAFALTSVIACRKPAPATLASASVAPSAPPSPALGPVVSSEVEVAGLRVKTGTLAARGPDTAARGGSGLLWGFTELGVDTRRVGLEIALAERGAPLAQLLPQGALAVVNGGYFEADFKPSTWLKNGGVELAKKSDTSKGGVLALGDGAPYVGSFAGLSFEPKLAVQSFPLIVEAEGKPGIYRDDGRRAARTVACLVDKALHFIVITAPRGDGPTLFESAAILAEPWPRGFGCSVALNLDGGPSTGVWFSPEVAAKQRAPFAPVAYAIALVPRR